MTLKTFKEFCEKEQANAIRFRTKIFTGEKFSFELRKEWRGVKGIDERTSPQKVELVSADNKILKIEVLEKLKLANADCRVEKNGKGNVIVQTRDLKHPLVVSTLSDFLQGYYKGKEAEGLKDAVMGLIMATYDKSTDDDADEEGYKLLVSSMAERFGEGDKDRVKEARNSGLNVFSKERIKSIVKNSPFIHLCEYLSSERFEQEGKVPSFDYDTSFLNQKLFYIGEKEEPVFQWYFV